MTKRITKSNIFPFIPRSPVKNSAAPGTSDDGTAQAQLLRRAEEKVRLGLRTAGAKRVKIAREALQIHPDCVDAYVLLSFENEDRAKRIELCRKGIEAGERVLGRDWKKRFKGIGWMSFETRPIMRAMVELANSLRWEDQLDEALTIYRELLEINPQDDQAVRYMLAPCLYERGLDKELESWLAELENDIAASLKYIKALHFFRKGGAGKEADEAMTAAFQSNPYVPFYLAGTMELPAEAPDSIQFGHESEAIDFVMDNSYLFADTEGALPWMADVIEGQLREAFADEIDLVDDTLNALRTSESG